MTLDSVSATLVAMEIARKELVIPATFDFQPNTRFFVDLWLDSDDVSLFIPAIEKRFQVKLTLAEWASIGSIDDLIQTLIKRGVVQNGPHFR